MAEIHRKIYFYQIVWVKNNNEKVQKDAKFTQNILQAVSKQIKNIIEQRLLYKQGDSDSDEAILFLERFENFGNRIIDKRKYKVANGYFDLYRISKIRINALPLIFDMKDIRTLALRLSDTQGLFEPSHFVVFNGKILGAEYNYYGVRHVNTKIMQLINDYLKENSEDLGVKRVEIKPILRKDVYDLINRFEEIRNIKISIATNYARLLCQQDPASFEQLFSAAKMVDDMFLTLVFSVGRGKKKLWLQSV